jgi:hypothetical protein
MSMGFFSLPLPLPRHESEQSVPGSDNGLVMESVFPSGVSEREREREREGWDLLFMGIIKSILWSHCNAQLMARGTGLFVVVPLFAYYYVP